MSSPESIPDFGENDQTSFESIMTVAMPDIDDWDEQFDPIDRSLLEQEAREEQSADAEVPVIEYLANNIASAAVLKDMITAIEQVSGDIPTCYRVANILDSMIIEKGGFYGMSLQRQKTLGRIYALAVFVQQLAGSETRETDMSKYTLLAEIAKSQLFTAKERDVLFDAADIFLASE